MIYQRVLVPVSGKNSGERAAKALRHAKTLCSGEIILLHVTEALPNLVGGAAHTELERSNTAKAETLLAPLAEELKKEGISEIHYIGNLEKTLDFVPAYVRTPWMISGMGILYGKK